MICATAQSSRNSSWVSQRLRSTSSRWTTASTPPNPCRASQVKEKNRSASEAGRGRGAGTVSLAAALDGGDGRGGGMPDYRCASACLSTIFPARGDLTSPGGKSLATCLPVIDIENLSAILSLSSHALVPSCALLPPFPSAGASPSCLVLLKHCICRSAS